MMGSSLLLSMHDALENPVFGSVCVTTAFYLCGRGGEVMSSSMHDTLESPVFGSICVCLCLSAKSNSPRA